MTHLISVIVATYNRPDALDAVLRSLSRQTDHNFEVLVADDGSKPDTAAVVAHWQSRIQRRVVHVWQPDNGFQLAEIRNRAIVAAAGEYCIFLDGDCIARPNFIAMHRALARRGRFVTGNRILMSQSLSEQILKEKLEPETWTFGKWRKIRRARQINRVAPLLSLALGPLRSLRQQDWRGAQGCNLGIWRSDLVAVDGFEGGFSSWGREDSDILIRLIHAGVRRKDGRMATGVLHLWHPEADRSRLAENERRLAEVLASNRTLAVHGLSALRETSAQPQPLS
jgi:glycosyltransferase involved in cell wall biosynthesis